MAKSASSYGPAIYRIEVKGRLSRQWTDWFDGVQIESEGDITRMTGNLDQSALFFRGELEHVAHQELNVILRVALEHVRRLAGEIVAETTALHGCGRLNVGEIEKRRGEIGVDYDVVVDAAGLYLNMLTNFWKNRESRQATACGKRNWLK